MWLVSDFKPEVFLGDQGSRKLFETGDPGDLDHLPGNFGDPQLN